MTSRLKEHLEMAATDEERLRIVYAVEEVLSRLEAEVVENMPDESLKEQVHASFQKYMHKLHSQRDELESALASVQ